MEGRWGSCKAGLPHEEPRPKGVDPGRDPEVSTLPFIVQSSFTLDAKVSLRDSPKTQQPGIKGKASRYHFEWEEAVIYGHWELQGLLHGSSLHCGGELEVLGRKMQQAMMFVIWCK